MSFVDYKQMTRGEMFSHWGKSTEAWNGVYPNPKTIQEQFETEIALIYRAGSKSHLQSSWGAFDFVAYSGTEFHNFRGTASPGEILKLHMKVAENRAENKFGVKGKDVISTLKLADLAGDGAKKIEQGLADTLTPAEAYEVAKNAYSAVNKKVVMSSIEDFIRMTEKDGDKKLVQAKNTVKQIRKLTGKIQGILDALAAIPTLPGEDEVDDVEGRITGGVKLDKSAYTGAKNILAFMDDMSRIADEIEKDPMKVPSNVVKSRKTIKLNKFTTDRDGKYTSTEIEREFTKVSRALSGTLANLTGGIFEIAYAGAVASNLNTIYSSVKMLGAGASTGSANAPLGQVKFGTSKTDLQLKMKEINNATDVEINLSVKGQKMAKPTKLHDSNIGSVMDLISTSSFQKNLLRIGFATPDMWKKRSQMNSFISALMADVAVAGLAGDKIDLVAYSDGVMTVEEFYKKLSMRNTLYFSGTRGGSLGKSANDVVDNGTTKIIFQT